MQHYGLPTNVAALFRSKTESDARVICDTICEAIRDAKNPIQPSLKQLYDGLEMALQDPETKFSEAVASGIFTTVTGTAIISAVMAAYASIPRVGRGLINEMPVNNESGKIAGFTDGGGLIEIGEAEEYKESEIGDKYVTFKARKYGRKLSITREAVAFDQTGQLLNRASRLGERMADFEEKLILYKIADATGYESYYPAGTQTALFSTNATETLTQTPANNSQTNALADWTDLNNVYKLLATKKNEAGDPIGISSNIALLAPYALKGTARYIISNTKDTQSSKSSAIAIPAETTATPGGDFYSPFLDALAVGTWYMGDFRRQYTLCRVWGPETQWVRGNDAPSMTMRDIIGAYKVSTFLDVVATDFRFVIRNTA